MGNLVLNKQSNIKSNKELFVSLKKIRKNDVLNIFDTIKEYYPSYFLLNIVEFEDIFGAAIQDVEPLFKILCFQENFEDKCDIHEALAIICLFSSESFEEKISLIFTLFDFDESGVIELSELVLTVQAVIKSLCKLEGVESPDIKFLENFSKNLFQEIDRDHNEVIDYSEFHNWINNNPTILQFLGVYAQMQSFKTLQTEFQVQMNKVMAIFDHSCSNDIVAISQIWDRLKETMMKIDKFSLDELYNTLLSTSQDKDGKISRDSFQEVMKAWISFSVTDITHDNYISISELKNLIWIYENEEPNDFRIIQEMQEIDEDSTETIDRIEWLRHLCNSEKRSGRQIFCSNLKKMFRKYDVDCSGSLSIEELKAMLKDSLNESLEQIPSQKNNPNRSLLVEMVVDGITQTLGSHNEEMQWKEFKNFMDEALEKQSKLVEILKK